MTGSMRSDFNVSGVSARAGRGPLSAETGRIENRSGTRSEKCSSALAVAPRRSSATAEQGMSSLSQVAMWREGVRSQSSARLRRDGVESRSHSRACTSSFSSAVRSRMRIIGNASSNQ